MSDQPHSADVLDDSRDRWWNTDFLVLLAERFGLSRVKRVLDVGCGQGHWGQLWAPLLPSEAAVIGVDPEDEWVEAASERASARGLSDRYTYRRGSAYALPFDDDTFDWVTCQTVLMHLADPGAALREMARVTAPGGLVTVAEPNNLAQYASLDSVAQLAPPEKSAEIVRFHLVCRRGALALGRGDEAVGERMPELMQRAGLEGVRACLNDLCLDTTPPYDDATREVLEMEVRFVEQGAWLYDRERARDLFLAGGGTGDDFEQVYALFVERGRALVKAVRAETFRWAGGHLQYVVWGRKPDGP